MSRRGSRTSDLRVLPVVAVGGMIGASARHAMDLAWPVSGSETPWSTLVVNASGCLLIGALMVVLVDLGVTHPVIRPFLGVGILGGYTTFSTYAVQSVGLLGREPLTAVGYLLGTLAAGLVAVSTGVVLARSALAARRRSYAMRREAG